MQVAQSKSSTEFHSQDILSKLTPSRWLLLAQSVFNWRCLQKS